MLARPPPLLVTVWGSLSLAPFASRNYACPTYTQTCRFSHSRGRAPPIFPYLHGHQLAGKRIPNDTPHPISPHPTSPQVTVFTAFLAMDLNRQDAGRMDWCCCCTSSAHLEASAQLSATRCGDLVFLFCVCFFAPRQANRTAGVLEAGSVHGFSSESVSFAVRPLDQARFRRCRKHRHGTGTSSTVS